MAHLQLSKVLLLRSKRSNHGPRQLLLTCEEKMQGLVEKVKVLGTCIVSHESPIQLSSFTVNETSSTSSATRISKCSCQSGCELYPSTFVRALDRQAMYCSRPHTITRIDPNGADLRVGPMFTVQYALEGLLAQASFSMPPKQPSMVVGTACRIDKFLCFGRPLPSKTPT